MEHDDDDQKCIATGGSEILTCRITQPKEYTSVLAVRRTTRFSNLSYWHSSGAHHLVASLSEDGCLQPFSSRILARPKSLQHASPVSVISRLV